MFAKWKLYFKSKMKKEEWGFDMVLLWQTVLNEFNVTANELIAGTTKACFAKELKGWPPTTATDFISLFRSDDDDEYPTSQAAFENACQNAGTDSNFRKWLHPVVLETANRLNFGSLKTADKYYIKQFNAVYQQVLSEAKNGVNFEIPESNQIEDKSNEHKPAPADSPVMSDWEKLKKQMGIKKEAV